MSQPQFDFGAGDDGVDALEPEGTYTVSDLAEVINTRLTRGFDDGLWVRGEIQGWNARGPHAYFTLADDQSDTKAVVSVAFFAPQRDRLRRLLDRHRLELGDGIKVRIHGYLDFYAPTGRLSLKMTGIDPRFTLGDLAMQREHVMRRLVAAGLADANKRRRLPLVPLRIGVVTSVGSAAWRDFEHELDASGVGFDLTVCDVRVQGETAVAMVSAAIATLSRHDLDAIVVIRGGGARNELAVFDAEPIAVAIANATHPVITGLGHEVDRSIADEVAHRSFKTPTACAQALCGAAFGFRRRADAAFGGVVGAAQRGVDDATLRVVERTQRIARQTYGAVTRADATLGRRVERLRGAAQRSVEAAQRRVATAAAVVRTRPPQTLVAAARDVDGLAAQVRARDPHLLLARGWSITRTAAGEVLRDPTAVAPGDVLVTEVAGGRVASTVTAGAEPPGATDAAAPAPRPLAHGEHHR